jgi:hypothetical protein
MTGASCFWYCAIVLTLIGHLSEWIGTSSQSEAVLVATGAGVCRGLPFRPRELKAVAVAWIEPQMESGGLSRRRLIERELAFFGWRQPIGMHDHDRCDQPCTIASKNVYYIVPGGKIVPLTAT